MPKKLLLLLPCIIASFIFISCGKEYNTANTYIPYQDDQYTYKNHAGTPIAESEEGYYFLAGYYLFYADKSTMKPIILCNKPNCLHYEETDPEKITSCNACFPSMSSSSSVSFFDGNVYVLKNNEGTVHELIRLSKDGTKRKTVLHFKYAPTSLAIHRRKVYVTSTVFDKDGNSIYGVSEYDLSKAATQKPVTIYEGKITGGNIQDIIGYGQNLYFREFAMNSEITAVRIQHYDLDTNKVTCIVQEEEDTFPSHMAFMDDTLLYNCTTIDSITGEITQIFNYMCELDGTNLKESFPIDNYQMLYSDGKYIYLDDAKFSPFSKPIEEVSLIVADSQGNEIASIPTGDYHKFSDIICGSDKHLFMINKIDSVKQILYANKDEFEAGTFDFKVMYEIDDDKMTPGYVTYN